MKNYKLTFGCLISYCLLLGCLPACKKNDGAYNYVNQTSKFTGNTYDFLKSKPGVFDSLLFVIDKLKLTDTLKTKNVTLFACTNESFQQVVAKVNVARKIAGKPPVYLNDMLPNLLDSIVCRYIIRGKYLADSLVYKDGLMLKAVRYNYPMNGKLATVNASGYVGGGPSKLVFSYTKKSVYIADWVQANANAVNIVTSNGVVHILEAAHPFGFGEYSKPVTTPYDKSTFRPIGYSGAFVFPSAIGGSTLIESEDYDMGGEGVAYHDLDVKNNGGNYRASEGVDIDAFVPAGSDAAGTYPASYSIGWTGAGEWVNYSINVPVEGDYTISARVGNSSTVNPLKFHYEIDYKNVTGSLTYPNKLGWWVWQLVVSPSFHVTAGNHVLRMFWETNDVQINNQVITRVN